MLGFGIGGGIGHSAVGGGFAPTNKIRNPIFAGGAAPSTPPTHMSIVRFNGLTVTYAYGTDGGLPCWDIAFSGTTSDALGGIISFEEDGGVAALDGQRWRSGAKVKLQAGALTNINGPKIQTDYFDAGVNYVGGEYSGGNFTPTSAMTEFARQITISQVGTAFQRHNLKLDWSAGVAINCTLRIVNPFTYIV